MKDDREQCLDGELGVVVCHVVPSFEYVTFKRHSRITDHRGRLIDGIQHIVGVHRSTHCHGILVH